MAGTEGKLPWPSAEELRRWRGLEELYRTHADWLRRHLARLGARAGEADDIVQDTWLRAAGRGEEIEHPKAFLSRTALNLLRDRSRREAVRERHRQVAANDIGIAARTPGFAEQEAEFELKQIILDLPEIYRDVFVLSRFRRMTNADIAAHFGISIKTVEWRLGKALELCMIRLRG